MKTIILLLLLVISLPLISQTTIRKKLAEEKHFSVTQIINSSDTSAYYYFSFQNQKYTHITDLGAILIMKKSEIIEMSSKLKEFSLIEDKVDMSFVANNYSLTLYDFSNNIYLTDKKGKYTTISKKEASKLSEDLLKYVELLKQ